MTSAPEKASRLGADIGVVLVGHALSLAVTFALTPVQLHEMGAEAYGIVAITWSVVIYFSFLDIGAGRALTRYIPHYIARGEPERAGAMVYSAILMSAALGLAAAMVVALAAHPLAYRFFTITPALRSQATFAFRVAGLLIPIFLLQSVASAIGRSLGLFRQSAVIKFATMAGINIAWAGAASKPNAIQLVALAHLGAASAALLAWLVVLLLQPDRPRIRRSGSVAVLKQLVAFGGLSSLTNLGWLLMTSADKLVLAAMIPAVRLPSYLIPFALAQRIVLLSAAATTVALPRMAAAAPAAGRTELNRVAAVVAVATGAVTAGLVWGGGSLLDLWLGEGVSTGATVPLIWLSLGFGILSVGSLDHAYLEATGGVALPAVNAIVSSVLGLSALAIGASAGGASAAAAGIAGGLALFGVLNVARSAGRGKARPADRLMWLLRSWPLTFAACGAAWFLAGEASASALVRLACVGVAGVAAGAVSLVRLVPDGRAARPG